MDRSWRKTFYSAFAAQFFAMLGFSFVLPFVPFYITKELGVPDVLTETARWSGLLAAATGFTMAIFAPIWGRLSDRYGRKIMVMRSMYGGAIVIALMGCAQNVWHLLILRGLQGCLTGTISASLALVACSTPREKTGFTVGMMQMSVLVGCSVGPFVGSMAANHLGFRPSFLVAGVLVLAGAILVHIFAEENFAAISEKKDDGSYKELFGIAAFVVAILAIFQVHFATTAPNAIFPLFVRDITRTGIEQATVITGNIASITGLVAGICTWFFGRLSDYWGHKKVLILSAIFAGLVALPQAWVQNTTQLYIVRILFGVSIAGIMPSANALIRMVVPERLIGRAYGASASVAGLAFFLGPLSGGYLTAHSGSYAPAFVLCGSVLLLVACLSAWKIPSEHILALKDKQESLIPQKAPASPIE